MNRSKLLSIAVIGLLVINLGTLAFLYFSNRGPHRMGHRPPPARGEGPRMIIIERLGFDKKQQEAYEVIIKDHQEKREALNQQSRELHDKLFSLLKETGVSVTGKDSIMADIALNQKNMDMLNFDHFQKIRSLCKEDQLKNYNALVDDLGELFKPNRLPHN